MSKYEDTLPQNLDIECKQIIEMLDTLTDNQRTEIFYWYCANCGRKQCRDLKDIHGCNCRDEQ